MEKLIKQRSILRSKVTRLCNKYENITISDNDELSLLIRDLNAARNDLLVIDNTILDTGEFTEEELETELDDAENYGKRIGVLLIKSERDFESRKASQPQFSHPPTLGRGGQN